jgi:hypothetical protein
MLFGGITMSDIYVMAHQYISTDTRVYDQRFCWLKEPDEDSKYTKNVTSGENAEARIDNFNTLLGYESAHTKNIPSQTPNQHHQTNISYIEFVTQPMVASLYLMRH